MFPHNYCLNIRSEQNKKFIEALEDRCPGQPIRSLNTDYEAVQANWIAPSGHRIRTSQSYPSLRTTKSYKPIISFLTDYEAIQANQIVPYGLRSRTSQSDRSLQTTKPYNPIRSFLTDYEAIQANQIAPDRSDGHRPEVQKR